jgi:hypothetical protein
MTKRDTVEPNDTLTEWLRAYPSAPAVDREICTRLIASPDMHKAWPSLLKTGESPVQIVSMTAKSYQSATLDVLRLRSTDEQESITSVQHATAALLSALRGAQLLDRGAPLMEMGSEQIWVAWTANCADGLGNAGPFGFPVLSLPDLLRILDQQCAERLDRTPTNSITRKRNDNDKETVRAFLRHLARDFRQVFGGEMPANLARIANAVFNIRDPLGGDEVGKILRDSPLKERNNGA